MPKKGAKKEDGYQAFSFEFRKTKGKNMSLNQSNKAAAKEWQGMNQQQRKEYLNRSQRHSVCFDKNKLDCTGRPVLFAQHEAEEKANKSKEMKISIDRIIDESLLLDNVFETQTFYFIDVNVFLINSCIPAEISIAEFSLKPKKKKVNKFHSFIKSDEIPTGYLNEAKELANTTHYLPLPPDAMGETNYDLLYTKIMNFINVSPENTKNIPPFYTLPNKLSIVEESLNVLSGNNDERHRVYSIEYLFYKFYVANCKKLNLDAPSIYFTSELFQRDPYELETDLACAYHEDVDRDRYCTLSRVLRWGMAIHSILNELKQKAVNVADEAKENYALDDASGACGVAAAWPIKPWPKENQPSLAPLTNAMHKLNLNGKAAANNDDDDDWQVSDKKAGNAKFQTNKKNDDWRVVGKRNNNYSSRYKKN